jgi:hypothetical protein
METATGVGIDCIGGSGVNGHRCGVVVKPCHVLRRGIFLVFTMIIERFIFGSKNIRFF